MVTPRTKRHTVYIRRIKTMNVPFEFCTVQKTTDELALLDSRATENFINERVWERLYIGQFKLPMPLTVHNVDGTKNHKGKTKFYCWLKISHQRQMECIRFYLTSLGGDNFILRYPFLYAFNPIINW